ncbi:MAG: WYL domain-containing protein [Hydrogenimonas sp.]|nr:WYL domain-containing protein [Hydrogenimonas sp.]
MTISYTFGMKPEEKIVIYLKHLHQQGLIDPYDEALQDELDGLGAKQIGRDLETLSNMLEGIKAIKKGRRKVYRLIKPIDIFSEMFRNNFKLGMLFEMARDGMQEIIEEWNEIAHKEHKPYMFFNIPFEDIDTIENNQNFISLKNAIERREYRHIDLKGYNPKSFKDVKPVKLLFSEGNWYVAYVDGKDLRISRIAFIDKVSYSCKSQAYQPSSVKQYLNWLKNGYQNPFSRYGIPSKTATLYAKPNIAHYFDEDMKKFFPSQQFIEKEANGGVRFSIRYTQEMEILPFVQRWMPDLLIESPSELKEAYRLKLKEAIGGINGH